GEIGIELAELGSLGDEALIGALGELGLHFDRLVERLDAEQLLHCRRGILERLLRIVRDFDGDRLRALGEGAERLQRRVHVLFADLLEVLEILDHGLDLSRPASREAMTSEFHPATSRGLTVFIYCAAQICQEPCCGAKSSAKSAGYR